MNQPLHLSSAVRIELTSPDRITLCNDQTGAKLGVCSKTFDLLKIFTVPTRLDSFDGQQLNADLLKTIETLLEHGFLRVAGATEGNDAVASLTQLAAPTFFLTPNKGPGALRKDLVFLGIPFDLASTGFSGSRSAPRSLRRISVSMPYANDPETARPCGWYSLDHGERLMENVTIGDLGDLRFDLGEPLEDVYARISALAKTCAAGCSFPVFIGGDHSITYPIICGLGKPMGVLHFDAHTDFAPLEPGRPHHHGNVMRKVSMLDHVVSIHQIGVRGYYSSFHSESKQHIFTRRSLRSSDGLNGLLRSLPHQLDYYLSLDIDVLDPVYAPGTGTPRSGGLSPADLEEILVCVAARRRIVAMDLVEVNSERDFHLSTCLLAFNLLVETLSAIFKARGQYSTAPQSCLPG